MVEFIAHNLAPISFMVVMAMLLLGYPVAFTLAAGGLLFFVVGVELSIFSSEIRLFWPLLQAHTERIFGVMANDTLLAIPFFTFMGLILERSRMAEDLLETIGQLFGPVRGGLAYAVVVVGALLAATTGVVAASVIAMGLISLPVMMRYGYSRPFATGTIAASGTLAQIVPPSLVLIVMADQLGRSVGDMYVGALYPALILIGLYCIYVFIVTMVSPKSAPALPVEARTLGGGVTSLAVVFAFAIGIYFVMSRFVLADLVQPGMDRASLNSASSSILVWSCSTAALVAYAIAQGRNLVIVVPVAALLAAALVYSEWPHGSAWLNVAITIVVTALFVVAANIAAGRLSRLAREVVTVLLPPLALIFLVLGTIFLGIATPTEGGAMGATGALVLAILKRRLDLRTLMQALDSTTKLACFVMFILIGARVFGLTFYGVEGARWIEELLLGLPGGVTGFLVTVTIIVFILGCFLDFFEIAFILVPLLVPVANTLGIDLIWFGIILGINLQASFLTPPFGFALFYLRSIAPNREWLDNVTGKMMPAVRTPEIYKGALPFIIIQVGMIGLIIWQPQLVTHYRDDITTLSDEQIENAIPGLGAPIGGDPLGGDGLGGGLNFGDDALGAPPEFGIPPNIGGEPNAAPSGIPGLELPGLDALDGDRFGAPPTVPAQPVAPTDDLDAPPTIDLNTPPTFN